ncbi:MAG: tRNA (adenosine(37)-N6)-dimethylallyltransferase MiaA [Alphaproteobacteria bacterium]
MNKQTRKEDKQTILIIGGPTASGKSSRALELAHKHDGIIINCDSMQIYDGLHMLTAQPPQEDLRQAPHHLYSALHPNETCSAGNWREMAEPLIEETLKQNKTPIIVGGSGLYIKALTDGLSPIPDIPQHIRNAAMAKQRELGNPAFHKELAKRDAVMAARFHPFHTARLIRAWEVLEATGKSLAEWQKVKPLSPPDNWGFKIEIIIPKRPILHQRCNDRFIWMIGNGALEEIETFSKRVENREIHHNVPLLKALGYRELLAFINGESSKKEAIEKSQARTRQYAKQQITWFKNQIIKNKKDITISER